MKILTTHYIDGAFVESHGREVMDIVRPTDAEIIARVTLADEEDARRAIAAARRAFGTYGKFKKEERAEILRQLHKAAVRRPNRAIRRERVPRRRESAAGDRVDP
jgi:aldehyde dehydrogenase (NAD+)